MQTMEFINGEEYLNKTEAARFLGVSFPTFEKNFQPRLHSYRSLKRSSTVLFKKADLEEIKMRMIEPRDD